MKHKKEVDELYRFLDLVKRDSALRECLELKKMKTIMPLVERDIKRRVLTFKANRSIIGIKS